MLSQLCWGLFSFEFYNVFLNMRNATEGEGGGYIFDMHNNNIELIQWSRDSCRLDICRPCNADLKPLSAPLTRSLSLLQHCKSERASSVASERGKLDKHSQILCIGCDCVRVCVFVFAYGLCFSNGNCSYLENH